MCMVFFVCHHRRKMTLLGTKLPQNALRFKRHQKEPFDFFLNFTDQSIEFIEYAKFSK